MLSRGTKRVSKGKREVVEAQILNRKTKPFSKARRPSRGKKTQIARLKEEWVGPRTKRGSKTITDN